MPEFIIANVYNHLNGEFVVAKLHLKGHYIHQIEPIAEDVHNLPYAIPGFVDAHVHIESSLLVPSQFARLAVVHGTVATVSDPHEIANVCGLTGVDYMIEDGNTVPFKFYFGAPSCVPATTFETAGGCLSLAEVTELLERPNVHYLSEMMNFPGVLQADADVMAKIAAAKAVGKPIDGHAPGLTGHAAQAYINAGISTDHECFTPEEALDKLLRGMKVLIREGSAAKNFDALIDLLHHWPQHIMFCSDDKHPDSLVLGHINQLCARAVAKGISVEKVLQAACVNPVKHYGLNVGLLQAGDAADFVLVENLIDFKVLQTYINGQLVAQDGQTAIAAQPARLVNKFAVKPVAVADLAVRFHSQPPFAIPVIEALDGQLITNKLMMPPSIVGGYLVSDTNTDLLKIVVVNRYHAAPIAKAFVKNFGLKRGAMASSVAHDSHNIVAVGADDESLARAINMVIAEQGGLSACHQVVSHEANTPFSEMLLPLPVAGLMSNADGYEVAAAYARLDAFSKSVLGATLASPFMTLSFMALLVIPHLKLSDKGLFDGDAFAFVNGWAAE